MHYSTYIKPYHLPFLIKCSQTLEGGLAAFFFLTSACADSGSCPCPYYGGVSCPCGCEGAFVPCCDEL